MKVEGQVQRHSAPHLNTMLFRCYPKCLEVTELALKQHLLVLKKRGKIYSKRGKKGVSEQTGEHWCAFSQFLAWFCAHFLGTLNCEYFFSLINSHFCPEKFAKYRINLYNKPQTKNAASILLLLSYNPSADRAASITKQPVTLDSTCPKRPI